MAQESWVIGLRPDYAPNAGSAWQPILYLRLVGEHHRVAHEDSTNAAEQRSGMRPSVYFYLGRNDPAYGQAVIACSRPSCSQLLKVAPFDTGGVINGKTPLKTAHAGAAERAVLAANASYSGTI